MGICELHDNLTPKPYKKYTKKKRKESNQNIKENQQIKREEIKARRNS